MATPTSIRLPRMKWGSLTKTKEAKDLILLAGGDQTLIEGVGARVALRHFLADAGKKLLDPRLVGFGQLHQLAARFAPALHHALVHHARLGIDARLQLVAFLDDDLAQVGGELGEPGTAHHAD